MEESEPANEDDETKTIQNKDESQLKTPGAAAQKAAENIKKQLI